MRARRWIVEQFHHCFFDPARDDMLPLAGLMMGFSPAEFENVGEEPFSDPMPSDYRFCH